MNPRISKIVSLAVFAFPIFLFGYTAFNPSVLKLSFIYSGYYFLLALVAVWVWTLVDYLKKQEFSIWIFLKAYYREILFSFLMASVIFISVKPELRVLNDETNLISSSRSMFYEKRADFSTEEVFWGGKIESFAREIPVRPLLFPFFLQMIHCILGYSVNNALVINFVFLFILFCHLAIALRGLWGTPWNYMAILLVVSQPIFSLSATSGGFELLQALFFVICITLLYLYLVDMQSHCFALLLSSLLMLSHIRYESPVFLILVILSLLFMRRIKFGELFSCWQFLLSPALLLPVFWQRILRPASDLPLDTPQDHHFGIEYFINHTAIFFRELIHFYPRIPFAGFVNFLAVAGVVLFIVLAVKKKINLSKAAWETIFILALNLIVIWCILASAHTGRVTRVTTGRYFLIFVVFFALAFLFLMRRMRFFRFRPAWGVIICAAATFFYYPAAVANPFFVNSSLTAKDYKAAARYLSTIDGEKIVVITRQPKSLIVNNYSGCISFKRATGMQKTLARALRRRLISQIYVVQTVNLNNLKPLTGHVLPSQFELQTVYEERTRDKSLVRVSRVVNLRA